MRVLVTGGSGFIGSHIVRALAERGDAVLSFDARPPGPEAAWWLHPVASRYTFVQGRVEDWVDLVVAMTNGPIDAVVHTAAVVNPVLLHRSPSLAVQVNLVGTFNVLAASHLFGVRRVVYFSSVGVLPGIRYEPVDVNHPVIVGNEGPGASFYGATKLAGEAFCFAFHQAYGLDFVALRPSAVYGFGMQWPIYIKPMVENSVRGIPTRFERGREFPRDYTHVGDVVQITLRALDVPSDRLRDRIFYAATGRPLVTAGAVAEIVRSLVPGADIEIGSGLSEEDLVEIRYRGVLSIENARVQLGYEPRYADIREGIAEYVAVYRRYLEETGG